MKDVLLYECIYCIVLRKINSKRVAYGHQTFKKKSSIFHAKALDGGGEGERVMYSLHPIPCGVATKCKNIHTEHLLPPHAILPTTSLT
jgi:hypothetical protein